MKKVVPVILSGGSGARLWPKSRKAYPKQLHRLYGDFTMLQHTANRVSHLQPPIVVCNEDQRFMVADQLAEVCKTPADILLEPVARNTAPAIAAATYFARQKYREDITLVVLPADHLIKDLKAFTHALDIAISKAQQGYLVTFGIVPTHPETGYGYIHTAQTPDKAGTRVTQFVEKPDKQTAEAYLQQGNSFWNSGMFVFDAETLQQEFDNAEISWLSFCYQSVDSAVRDLDFNRLDQSNFEQCQAISFDVAIMERANKEANKKTQKSWVVPLNAGWSDLGSWESLWDFSEKDTNGNVSFGDTIIQDCTNSYVNSDDKLVVAVGLENTIIVESDDALLVVNKNRTQYVKEVVDKLVEENRSEYQHHREVHKRWGCFDSIDKGNGYKVNRIEIKPGASLTLQTHQHRAEHWVVVKGVARIECNGQQQLLEQNQSIYVPKGKKHKLSNAGESTLYIIEIQTGDQLDESDIVRFDKN